MAFVIKAEARDPLPGVFVFNNMKTMCGGRRIAKGDVVFVFARENEGGRGLAAAGVVTFVEATPRTRTLARQTPRVTVQVKRVALASRRLGRGELREFAAVLDDGPESELNFKVYWQATSKIAGISGRTAAWLDGFFRASR